MDERAFKSPKPVLSYTLGCPPFSLLCLQWNVTLEKGLWLGVALLCLAETLPLKLPPAAVTSSEMGLHVGGPHGCVRGWIWQSKGQKGVLGEERTMFGGGRMLFRMESLGMCYHWTQSCPNGNGKPMGIVLDWWCWFPLSSGMDWNVVGCLCVPPRLAAGMPSVRQGFWNGREPCHGSSVKICWSLNGNNTNL